MKPFFSVRTLVAGLLLGFGVTLPYQSKLSRSREEFSVVANLDSTERGHVQIYYDSGSGFSELDSTTVPLEKSERPVSYRLSLPPGRYRALRFDPIDRDGTVTIADAKIVDGRGRPVRQLPFSQFQPLHEIQSLRTTAAGLVATVVPGTDDPQLLLTFDPALVLQASWMPFLESWLKCGGVATLALLAAAWALGKGVDLPSATSRFQRWS